VKQQQATLAGHINVIPNLIPTAQLRSLGGVFGEVNKNKKMPSTASHSGRIRPHQRDTDDAAPVLGSALSAPEGFLEKFNESNEKSM
jgi:hypothetical protein